MGPQQKRENAFREVFKGRVVIAGVGNVLRGDDGLGPVLAERLRTRVDAPCINAGSALENHLGAIIRERPDTVLLIDAVHLGLEPGDYELVDPNHIAQAGLSTHDASPSFVLDVLSAETGADIFLLGVQPASLKLGAGISLPVRRTLGVLTLQIAEALSCLKPGHGPAVKKSASPLKDGVLKWK